MFPYRLFHGTSSHWLDHFSVGSAALPWPHKSAALDFYREIWKRLGIAGIEPSWSERAILEQCSNGVSNWQHGELMVSPSRFTATKYARSNAEYGGELLSLSMQFLERLEKVAPQAADDTKHQFEALKPFLTGGGYPILVEFVGVQMEELELERIDENVSREVAMQRAMSSLEEDRRVLDDEGFDEICQQTNFRLSAGAGIVACVQRIEAAAYI